MLRSVTQILLILHTKGHGANVMKSLLKSQIETSYIDFKPDTLLKDKMKLFGIKYSFQTISIEKMLLSKLYRLLCLRLRTLMKFLVLSKHS